MHILNFINQYLIEDSFIQLYPIRFIYTKITILLITCKPNSSAAQLHIIHHGNNVPQKSFHEMK